MSSNQIVFFDTTLRDGEQTRHVSFSTSEKVSIAEALLGSLRVDRIEVASAAVSDGEREAVTRIAEWAKSEGHLDECNGTDPWRVLTELFAKMVALVLQHWLLLVSCWHRRERSLRFTSTR